MADAEKKVEAQSNGIDPKTSGILSWILAPIGSLIVLASNKDEFSKFHAWQSLAWSGVVIFLFIIISVLSVCTLGLGACLYFLLFFMYVVNIIGAVKSANGEMWKAPIIGDWAEGMAKK